MEAIGFAVVVTLFAIALLFALSPAYSVAVILLSHTRIKSLGRVWIRWDDFWVRVEERYRHDD